MLGKETKKIFENFFWEMAYIFLLNCVCNNRRELSENDFCKDSSIVLVRDGT